MAEEMNRFFTDLGPGLARNIPNSFLNLDLEPDANAVKLRLSHTDPAEVRKLLMKISDAKATGSDGVPIRFVKLCSDTVIPIIVHIINRSIDTCIVPSDWKRADVTALYKDGDRTLASNYHPISILPALSKILERVVHVQVYDYMESNSILSDAQFGFRKGHSTSSCTLHLLDNIYKSIDENKYIGVVFLDLKKAFDTVDHHIMLQKLSKYGLSANAVNWFRDYLTGREQRTKIMGSKSVFRNIVCGVPQGSILGPLLFILYINDLQCYLGDSRINLYADDTALYVVSDTLIELILTLREELSVVEQWLAANKLTLNASKTKIMLFGTKRKLNNIGNFNITMGGEILERVENFKYLGIVLDQHLTFSEHINKLYQKCSMKMGAIRKIRKSLDQTTALSLYKSLILSNIDYCDIVYNSSTLENLNRLQLLQNSACRTILLAPYDTHVSEMHRTLGLLPLDKRRFLHMSFDCHKSVYFNGKSSLSGFYVPVLQD